MKLQAWTDLHSQTDAHWAEKVGITRVGFMMIRKGARIPRPDVMRLIFDVTGGAVTPNDFCLTPEQLQILADQEVAA